MRRPHSWRACSQLRAREGLIVGVVTLTGLGLRFADIVITYAGGSLVLTAIYTALIVWVGTRAAGGGALFVYPRAMFDAIGIALFSAALALQWVRRRRAATQGG
jgi:hypothetical protein